MIDTYKEILVFLLLVHVLSDFYFQNGAIATKKEKQFKWVAIHSFIYGFIWLVFIKTIISNFNYEYLIIIITSHFAIDTMKFCCTKSSFPAQWKKYAFFIDQFAHVVILMVISYFVIKTGIVYEYNNIVQEVFNIMGVSIGFVFSLFLKVILINKPINIFIVLIMNDYKPPNKNEAIRTGKAIGTLERVIMLFFLSIQQYSSIGLVLTAKSIARYNKISEDQAFAEYYLLGTLLSTICVLAVSLI